MHIWIISLYFDEMNANRTIAHNAVPVRAFVLGMGCRLSVHATTFDKRLSSLEINQS